jgi:hypothetical protein
MSQMRNKRTFAENEIRRVLSQQQETLGQLLYLLCFSYLTGPPWAREW